MVSKREHFEYGYRLNGAEFWEVDHGTDGSWIPANLDPYVPAIDVNAGSEVESIYRVLDEAVDDGVVIRRMVLSTVLDTEEIQKPRTI